MHRILLLLSLCLSVGTSLFAQTDTIINENKLDAYPLVFYLPETSFGFGGAGIYTFRLKGEENNSRPSQIQGVAAYTLKKQILTYAYIELYQGDQKWWTRGEFGFYKYFYDFFGVGNDNPIDYVETFGVTYPRVRLTVQRRLLPNFYSGVRYWYDRYNITETEENGMLASGNTTGGSGGDVSGIGWISTFDNRDNIFSPSKGFLIEAVGFWNRPALGSEFNFSRYTLDVATYISTYKKQVLALNLYGGWITGDAPFNELLFLGGPRKGRGFYEGRFRDDHLLLMQAEYRFPLFWKIGMTVFGSYGAVAHTINDYEAENFKLLAGVGIRYLLNPKEGVNLRGDIAFGKDSFAFYFTVGEAF